MIVAQQVQNAVKNKNAHFQVEGVAPAESVAARHGGRDGDVSEIVTRKSRRRSGRRKACGARTTRLTMLSTGGGFCLRAICWKGQYICWTIFATVGAIPASDLRVGNQSDGERARREAQALASGGEEFLQAGNGNTNATLAIEDHAREINPADSAGQNGRRAPCLTRDRCGRDERRRVRRRP